MLLEAKGEGEESCTYDFLPSQKLKARVYLVEICHVY